MVVGGGGTMLTAIKAAGGPTLWIVHIESKERRLG